MYVYLPSCRFTTLFPEAIAFYPHALQGGADALRLAALLSTNLPLQEADQ